MMKVETAMKAIATILGIWLVLATPAWAGIKFTGPAAFAANGAPSVVRGDGSFADTATLSNAVDGLKLGGGGAWTYTSTAADVGKTVEVDFTATRTFDYSLDHYFASADFDLTANGPAGVVGQLIVTTRWMTLSATDDTTATAKRAFTLTGLDLDLSRDDKGAEISPTSAGSDTLIVGGQLAFDPTASGEVFTFAFSNKISGATAILPEPSSLGLALVGGLSVAFAVRRRPRRA